ncbi:Hypothetical predicted protein [Paramuricea clavata]|uniref:Uncharacterized protein n=1 Tax=Paramuricea clavata TaxID=317549 RepID=A0A7D9HTB5_PARCT|nr:Hypothetical predicted protein [Paramuricea clavata]
MKRMFLPTPEPPVFSGNILTYPKWMLGFDALIDGEAVNPSHKLYYLGEYTSEQTQERIYGLLGLQTDDEYKRLGRYSKNVLEFSYFLVKGQETKKTVKHLKDFDTFSAIQDLVVRLPPYYSKKWLQSAKVVELVLLSKRKELLKDRKQEDKNSYRKRKFGSFNTCKYNESSGHSDKNTNELMCPACKKPHKLENCDIFLNNSVKERSELAKSKGLCFLCLCHGHMARSCKESIRCQTCKKPHATLLRFESKESKNGNKKENEESCKEKPKVANRVVVGHSNDCNEETTSYLILPVWICHKDNREKKIMTYAVLDDQSAHAL